MTLKHNNIIYLLIYEHIGLASRQDVSAVGQRTRLTVVVNRFNGGELDDVLGLIARHDNVTYLQLRRVYRYEGGGDAELAANREAFDRMAAQVRSRGTKISGFHESERFMIDGIEVSLWATVFRSTNLRTLNYFTDGFIADDSVLVRARTMATAGDHPIMQAD